MDSNLFNQLMSSIKDMNSFRSGKCDVAARVTPMIPSDIEHKNMQKSINEVLTKQSQLTNKQN